MDEENLPAILLADPYIQTTHIITNTLRQIGLQNPVMSFKDGSQTFFALENHVTECALIIANEVMNPMSGLMLLKFLRNQEQYKHIPFLLMSSSPTRELVTEVMKQGRASVIVKPFPASALTVQLDKLKLLAA